MSPRIHRRSREKIAMLALAGFALAGCASLPGVPAGPVAAPGARLGVTYAYAYAPARSRVTELSTGEPHTLRGNSEMHRGLIPLFPLRAMARIAPSSFFDFGADAGWTDTGFQLRAGELGAQSSLPWGLELEWRTGRFALLEDDFLKRSSVYRARAELYPPLGRLGELDTSGVLSLGLSHGVWWHALGVPGEFHYNQTEGSFSPPSLDVVRSETRLEMSLGAHGRASKRAATIALMPWLVLDRGRVREAECAGCFLEYRSFDVAWGVALALSGSFVLELE